MAAVRVGEPAPDFAVRCIQAGDATARSITLSHYSGRWLALVFYPRDFTFVCPTELTAFSARLPDFHNRECELLGISVDSIELHCEWLSTSPADGGLGPLQFPLASDTGGATARAYGVWVDNKEVSTRGLFIIDPEGILQYSVVHNLSVGRSPDEVLRVLDALRTGGLCPASWTSADGTIDPERALRPGRILGHYRIRGKLGGGTFGTVFAVWDLRLEREVALKVLKRNVFESREAALAESRAAAKLNDPHVCTLYAVEEEDGLPVIAMEYIDGRPLSQLIADRLPRDTALDLAAQIASGLSVAHAQGVVHGDLKPANIMVTNKGIAKILDFGLARSCQAGPEAGKVADPRVTTGAPDITPDITPDATPDVKPDIARDIEALDATVDSGRSMVHDTSGIRGSLAYMAPEQALGFPATPASDVFAFGLVLVEMLTGRCAHTEQSPVRLIMRLQTEDLAPELAREVDGACRDLVLPMLSRVAGQRPTMSTVVRTLGTFANS